jgi:hypothetical protein
MPIEQSEAEIISAWQMLTDDGVAEIWKVGARSHEANWGGTSIPMVKLSRKLEQTPARTSVSLVGRTAYGRRPSSANFWRRIAARCVRELAR